MRDHAIRRDHLHKAGHSVYFATLADIVSALAKAEREGQLRERIRFFCRAALLIVDEIGYLPVTPGGGNLFFQLVSSRYERASVIVNSNKAFSRWGEVFGDDTVAAAMIDRLVHRRHHRRVGSPHRVFDACKLLQPHVVCLHRRMHCVEGEVEEERLGLVRAELLPDVLDLDAPVRQCRQSSPPDA